MRKLNINKDNIKKYLQCCLVGIIIIVLFYYLFFCKVFTFALNFKVEISPWNFKMYPSEVKIILKNNKLDNIQKTYVFESEEVVKYVLKSTNFTYLYNNENSTKPYDIKIKGNKIIINHLENKLYIDGISKPEFIFGLTSGMLYLKIRQDNTYTNSLYEIFRYYYGSEVEQ